MTKTQAKEAEGISDQQRALILVYSLCLVLVAVSLVCAYAIMTLNFILMGALVLIMVLQKLLCRRNQVFIDFIVKHCKNYKYFDKFEHIY